MAYDKAPTTAEKERMQTEGDSIKFIDFRFEIRQGFWK